MNVRGGSAEKAKLVGGRLCLDFVNTVGGRVNSGFRDDKLQEFRDLVLWSRHVGSIPVGETRKLIHEGSRNTYKAAAVLRRAILLREAIYRICLAAMEARVPLSLDLEILNRELQAARSHEMLAGRAGRFAWEWKQVGAWIDCFGLSWLQPQNY